MATKEELRQQAKILRKKLNPERSSENIIKQIINWGKFKSVCNIMIYYPINNEISLLALPDDKTYFLPKVVENDIQVCPFAKNELVKGKFGIPEPESEPIDDLDVLDMVFVPALAADRWGYRIGYGGGYYDRFLVRLNKKTLKVIPMYSELMLGDIPIEPHDIKVDFIVTEREILSTTLKLAVN